MKKLVLLFFILSVFVIGAAGERVSVSLMGNFLGPADAEFKDFYGSGQLFPEGRLSITVYRGFYFWGGYGSFSANGETEPQFQEETKWTQSFLFYGVGYNASLSRSMAANLRLGGVSTSYKEEALGIEIDESATGFIASASLVFYIAKFFFTELEMGYISVSDEVEGVSIDLGGFKAGIGIGVRF